MTLDDLQVGQEIEYTVLRSHNRTYERKGKIKQITPSFITVSLARWNDTIGIQDINPDKPGIGSVLIPAIKGGSELPAITKTAKASNKKTTAVNTLAADAPTDKSNDVTQGDRLPEVQNVAPGSNAEGAYPLTDIKDVVDWEKTWPLVMVMRGQGKSLKEIAAELSISYSALSHKVSRVKGPVRQVQSVDPGYFDLPGLKLDLIATVLTAGRGNNCPNEHTLSLIQQINEMELPEAI